MEDVNPPPSPAATPSADPRIGTVLAGKWTVDRAIGSGGMATVYAATHRNGSRVALKVLHVEFARDVEIKERFLREGRIANQVDHPARVPVLDDDVTEHGEPFLVMELLEGEPLSVLLRKSGRKLPVEQALRIFDPVLDLLAACHSVGVVHRDIKPANIFITNTGQVRVLDFGVARMRLADQALTRAGTALGTPAYMAPEQAGGVSEMVDGRADVFSVGACLYAALSGQRLHKSRSENHALVMAATKAAPSLARIAPDLPVEVVAFVDKALAFDRENRYQDAAAMRQDLLRLLAGLRTGKIAPARIEKRAGVVVRASDDVVDDSEAKDSPEERARRLQLLQDLWKLTSNYLATVRQYGHSHPNSARSLDTAFEALVAALTFDPAGVCWDVTPFGFTVGEDVVWEPDKAPFDRIPYQLFADGFRKLQVTRGVSQQELYDFLTLISREEAGGEDDAVSAFWDRRFEHFIYFAVDSFAEGDGQARKDFAEQCERTAQQAILSAQLDRSWHVDSTEARALEENLQAAMREAGQAAESIAVEAPIRASLGIQANEPPERWLDRFVDAFADGYLESCRAGDAPLLAGVLQEWSRDQITLRNLDGLFETFGWIVRAVSLRKGVEPRQIERELGDVVFGTERLRAILALVAQGGLAQTLPSKQVVDGIAALLRSSDSDALLVSACECFQSVHSDALRDALVGYVSRWAEGHESDLAKVLAGADPELSLAILRVVTRAASPQAMLVIERALYSTHPGVRSEALQQMPASFAEKLSQKIEKLTHDPDSGVRREALRATVRFRLANLVPALSRRALDSTFHEIPITERREWLSTLWQLAPARAEEVLIAIVSDKRLIPSDSIEETRAVAVDVLGQASSVEALQAARLASRKWWWNSPGVREAGARSAEAIAARLGANAPDSTSSGQQDGSR